ncbi:MAG: DUF805 domain-containing protein [Pseudomonadota bacterium]
MAGRPGPRSVFWALFSLRGRIRRSTFLLGAALIATLWWVCLAQVFSAVDGSSEQESWLLTLGALVLFSSYCLYALAHKRLHDLGYRGFFALIIVVAGTFIPFLTIAGLTALAVVPGEQDNNDYGPPPVRSKT